VTEERNAFEDCLSEGARCVLLRLQPCLLSARSEQAYKQTDLDSDIQGLAQNPPNGQADTQLGNPWGRIASPTSPWWLSDKLMVFRLSTTDKE
jgi:hypothetical protein